ncbi:hypothetical protein CHH28_12845 [Bacterioplanes sanyensis]|uniref:DUF4124 domain-containing protein n=1 Tax=Bacterioplanes sanyensis TaxID=1249553 RepID=A0A222FKE7_9GAMM|nr:DUF4124 domain-containing protein [Bacterioplanes sanyensis]ASP39505.1 hypothetical protein CHH28_12845 [Bacterioplanes sanyensis]
MIRIVLVITCLLASAAQAQVYRWVDDEGRVHFGDRPPVSEKKAAEKVTVQVPKAPSEGGSFERRQRQQELLDTWQQERQQRNEKRQAAKEEKDKKEALCKQLLAEKLDAERSTHVYKLNEQGEREYFDEAKAQEYLKGIAKRYQETCQ